MSFFDYSGNDTYYCDKQFVEEEKKDKLKNSIKTTMLLLLIALPMYSIRSHKDESINMTIWFIVIGAVLIVLGLTDMLIGKCTYPEEKIRPVSHILTGTAVVALSIFFHGFTDGIKEKKLPMFTYIVALLVIVDGVTRIIHEIMKVSQKKRRCTQAVTATCLDLRYIYGRHRRIMYYIHIWQYDFWGETIIVSDKIHDPSLEPNIGVSAEIMINPDDPRDIFRSVPKIADTQIGIGIVTAAMGLIMEVGFIYIHIMG